jgi:transposase
MMKADGRPLRIMFEDEARFGRISDPRRCWAPFPFRPLVHAAVVQEFTYAYAAVSPHDGVLDSLILPGVGTDMMNLFVTEVATRHPNEFLIMIMDGAGWHTAKDLSIPENMSILHLPPYSPELNPVEHLWDEIREKDFSNEVFATITALEVHLMQALARMEGNHQRIRSITGWDWIIGAILNAN